MYKKEFFLQKRNKQVGHHADDGYNGDDVPDNLVAPLGA